MSGGWRKVAKKLVPAPLRRTARRVFGWRWFKGDYPNWSDARAASAGYDDAAVLARVVAAARQVRSQPGLWDRDGFVFSDPVLHEPLVNALRQAAVTAGEPLTVLDFGGGLGSTWWQHRGALDRIVSGWRVVEQPAFVAAGQKEFGDGVLSFHATLAEACAPGQPRVILLSSVLPYLESPHALLDEVGARRFAHVIVDRTPFIVGGRDRLVVQANPPELGGDSYPCRLFDRAGLEVHFRNDYRLLAEWPVEFDEVDGTVGYHGLHFELRAQPVASPASVGS
jgi:putative methyltransferase (TIGR04325 family)